MGRRKRLRAVATFASTHDAVEAEALCKGAGIAGRLIPTPVAVRATCGSPGPWTRPTAGPSRPWPEGGSP